jgi:hypothetical protein
VSELQREIDVRVFDLSAVKQGVKAKNPEPQDWDAFMDHLATLTVEERTVGGVYFEPKRVGGHGLLTMHKPLDSRFMSELGADGSFSDVLPAGESTRRLAHSSCVLFSRSTTSVGIIKGHVSAPGHTHLKYFLRIWAEMDGGYGWDVRSIRKNDDLQRLKDAPGIYGFSTKVDTTEAVLDLSGHAQGSMVDYANSLKRTVGGDVELTLTVKLTKSSRTRPASQGLKQVLMSDFDETVGRTGTGKATIPDGTASEVINLVTHNLAIPVQLPETGSERTKFSELLAALASVRNEVERYGNRLI